MSGIPTHLVLGPLGSGKTTTVLALLEAVPAGERWAVLVNEFGRVPVDPALIRGGSRLGDRLQVRESGGGCICCSAGPDLETGLCEIAGHIRPDGILVEPSGLAAPDGLKARLLREGPDWGVRLASVVAVLDVRRFADPRILDVPYWQALLEAADFILGSRADLAGPAARESFRTLVGDPEDPEIPVFTDRALLAEALRAGKTRGPRRDGPVFRPAGRVSHREESAGLVFPKEKRFRFDAVLACLAELPDGVVRVKGIFQTPDGPRAVQSVGGDPLETASSDYRADSRIEILYLAPGPDVDALKAALQKAVLNPGNPPA